MRMVAVLFILLVTTPAWSQEDTTRAKRLSSPAVARGVIGGESHDTYVIKAKKGRLMTVHLSWKREADNHADVTISTEANFFNAQQVDFGQWDSAQKRWTGKIPKTQDYYLYVVGHPTVHYTLKVKVK